MDNLMIFAGSGSRRLTGRICTAIIVDDFIISGGTFIQVAQKLVKRGVERIVTAVTHGVFAPGCMQKLMDSPIERLFITDTVENQPSN